MVNDMEKLLTDNDLLETASSLMRRATALGLNVPKEAAKTMVERWLFAEKGFQVMKDAGESEAPDAPCEPEPDRRCAGGAARHRAADQRAAAFRAAAASLARALP